MLVIPSIEKMVDSLGNDGNSLPKLDGKIVELEKAHKMLHEKDSPTKIRQLLSPIVDVLGNHTFSIEQLINFIQLRERLNVIDDKKSSPQSLNDKLSDRLTEIRGILNLSIDQLSIIENKDTLSHSLDKLRESRNETEKIWRHAKLLSPADPDFAAAIRWASAQGNGIELGVINTLQNCMDEPGYDIYFSPEIQQLVIQAKNKIEQRIYAKVRYKIFASEKELYRFREKINFIQSYPAYSFVSGVTKETISEVEQYFRVEEIESSQESKSSSGAFNMTTRDRVVKFNAPVLESWKQRIEETGSTILQPLGRLEFVVSVPSEDIANQIRNFEEVAQVTSYVPNIRVQPQSLQNLGQPATKEAIAAARLNAAKNANNSPPRNLTLPGILVAIFFSTEDRDGAAQNLESISGIRIADRPGKDLLIIDISAATNALDLFKIITSQEGLRSLEEKTIPRIFNEKAGRVIAKGVIPSNPTTTIGLTGRGEIIAIADTGLDTGDRELLHLDLQGRVIDIKSYPITKGWWETYLQNMGDDDGPSDKYSGHGTHVAGSALGDGTQARVLKISSIPIGTASEAKLIFQAVEQTTKWTLEGSFFYMENFRTMPPPSALFGIPEDLTELFKYAYDRGARIHSNSWGGGGDGFYDFRCQKLDEFVWNQKDFLVVVAAGNNGKHGSSGNGIEQSNVNTPGTAKNCLTIGASENDRSGQFADTYGNQYPDNFPYEPYKSVRIADSIDDIAPFSSRGPCLDKYHQPTRCKPDLVAPGTFVLSTRSSQIASNNFADAPYPPARYHYMYMHGTSMATPLVAGCAALVRQYLREKHQPSIPTPSAAFVKAILIHSAQYINYLHAHAASAPWADNEQGWGRIDLQTVLNPAAGTKVLFIDEANGLTTGENREYKLKITKSAVPLKVNLVYTDYPGEDLINNLNLIVHSPSGKHYLGNDFEEAGTPDNINNVEGVVVKSPEIGEWRIEIVADVQMGQQDYAVVISGGGALRIS
jgi:serine protease AprX